MPLQPVVPVAAVLNHVSLGELISHSVGVASLRAHQGDEVQRAQVHLEIVLEAVRLRQHVRAPGPISVSVVGVESEVVENMRHGDGNRGRRVQEVEEEKRGRGKKD